MKNRTLVGFCTFGGTKFSQLAVQSIRETSTEEVDFFAIVGKPGDIETIEWLEEEGIPYKVHEKNMGFPYSVNDIYDYAWKENDYPYLILMGNDIVAYPKAINQLIYVADTTDNEVISALQYDVKLGLTVEFPETLEIFEGENLVYNGKGKPWEKFTDYDLELEVADMKLYDIQNLCLYTKKYFEVIGYTDVNFFPAYFIDNDLARRIVNSGLKCCSVTSARFFHFWSRTLHESKDHDHTPPKFERNRGYYIEKWGGDFKEETIEAPCLISSREGEEEVVAYWRNKKEKIKWT